MARAVLSFITVARALPPGRAPARHLDPSTLVVAPPIVPLSCCVVIVFRLTLRIRPPKSTDPMRGKVVEYYLSSSERDMTYGRSDYHLADSTVLAFFTIRC